MKFRIQNFQSIKDEEFDFENLTSLVGPTDRGKSAISRAIKSLFYNDWEEGFLRRGTKKCIITATFPEKYPISQIIQEKGKSTNSYLIKFRDGRKDKFIPKAGVKVPDEIKQLGFAIIETERGDKFNLNFQEQYDPLFLVGEKSEPLVTSFFNYIFKVTKYERALKMMTADNLALNREYKANEEKLEESQASLAQTESKYIQISEQIKEFGIKYQSYLDCESEIEKYVEGIRQLERLNSLLLQVNQIKNHMAVKERVFEIVVKYQNGFDEYSNLINKLNNLICFKKEGTILWEKQEKLQTFTKELNLYLNQLKSYLNVVLFLNDIINRRCNLNYINTQVNDLNQIKQVMGKYSEKYKEYLEVLSLYESLIITRQQISSYETTRFNINNLFKYFDPILSYRNDLEMLYNYNSRLIVLGKDVQKVTGQKDQVEIEYNKVIQYEKFVKSVISVCPLCKKPLMEEGC